MMMKRLLLALLALSLLAGAASALETVDVAALQDFAARHTAKWESWRGPAWEAAKLETTGLYGQINADPNLELMGIKPDGTPVIGRLRNVDAAASTRTTAVIPGGDSGYDLDGSTTTGLYHWDGSAADPDHPELSGRVTIGDGANTSSAHASHTAGTMIASGVQANAKGMAVGASLTTYDWDNDQAEMALAAADDAKVSSHSYGFGSLGGGYDEWARGYDEITWAAPNYLIFIAAGNAGSTGFGTLYEDVNGKNTIAVGNVEDVPVYDGPGSVQINSSSSVGPTDDGRIKPDIVGNGTGLYSCNNSGGYTTMTGTSMASPNVAGSAWLMYEHYEATHNGEVPRSATMKAVLLNTADECGPNPGPDYKYGFGLMNTTAAIDLIDEDAIINPNSIMENTLIEGAVDVFNFTSDGTEPLKATLCWIEPPSALYADPVLLNDLDMTIEYTGGGVYQPWTLDVNNPGAAAQPGDNDVDNNEQILIEDPLPGQYIVTITHEGSLTEDQLDYSLAVSGAFGGEAPEHVLMMTPDWNYIWPSGSELRYWVRYLHNRDYAVPGLTFWTEVTLPNGQPYGPVFQANFNAGPWMNQEVYLIQDIPGFAPGGVYEYIGNVGLFPNEAYDTDSFPMIKFFPGDWDPGADNHIGPQPDEPVTAWAGHGWDIGQPERQVVSAEEALPKAYELGEAYPNPFNPTTTLSVALPEAAELTVTVHNLQGRQVATLAQGQMPAGNHTLTFDGSGLASGIYFINAIVPGELNQVRKVTLMK